MAALTRSQDQVSLHWGGTPTAAGVVVALAMAMVAIAAGPVPAQEVPPIQPGVSISTDAGYCTLSWIFERIEADDDDPGTEPQVSIFGSTAAHCVEEVGQQVNLAETSLGATIERLGEVAFIGDADEDGRDYAFVEIDEDNWGQVDPAMAGHPDIPTGVSDSPQQGDLMQFSGHGVGFHASEPTREERVGVLNWFDDKEHQVTGGVSPGDSGGPVADLTEGNTAFGIVNTLGAGAVFPSLTVVQAGEGGANLAFVLADAASHGFDVDLCVVDQPCGQA